MKETPDRMWLEAAEAFDSVAPRYDRIPFENRINGYMRRLSLGKLRSTFRPGDRVIELGCGTGDEAIDLATININVVALDASSEMVRLAREKAATKGLANPPDFLHAPARDLPRLVGTIGSRFDGAYASFSLGYEPDLAPVATGLHELLRPNAEVLASVPSRLCLVELLLAMAAGRPSYAGRRLRTWYGHRVGDRLVPIRSYTPHAFKRAMGPNFALVGWEPLPAILPPPYMNRWYARLNGVAEILEGLDVRRVTRRVFRSLGDHVLIELQHTSSPLFDESRGRAPPKGPD